MVQIFFFRSIFQNYEFLVRNEFKDQMSEINPLSTQEQVINVKKIINFCGEFCSSILTSKKDPNVNLQFTKKFFRPSHS